LQHHRPTENNHKISAADCVKSISPVILFISGGFTTLKNLLSQIIYSLSFTQTPLEKGQGLIEYALIILLIVLGVLLVLGLVGGQVQNAFQVIVDALAGAAGS
jgi:Flp pilus assembly pilin Flp